MIFRHAGASGAKTFDGVKVKSIDFDSSNGTMNGTTNGTANGDAHSTSLIPGRPISATYTKKANNTSGVIKFDYIVDASGRVGLLNTKYLKNRHYNTTLKNVANWAYFEDAGLYGGGTARSGAPFFEALRGMFAPCYAFPLPPLKIYPDRREWLGLVYSSARRYPFYRGCHEPGHRYGEEGHGGVRPGILRYCSETSPDAFGASRGRQASVRTQSRFGLLVPLELICIPVRAHCWRFRVLH